MLMVLNEMRQLAAPLPSRSAGLQRGTDGLPARMAASARVAAASTVPGPMLRPADAQVAADSKHSASHLLAAASELCPLSLLPLLLGA